MEVPLEEGIRQSVRDSFLEMHQYFQRNYTPKVRRTKACNACSLKNLCLPQLMKQKSARDYVDRQIGMDFDDLAGDA